MAINQNQDLRTCYYLGSVAMFLLRFANLKILVLGMADLAIIYCLMNTRYFLKAWPHQQQSLAGKLTVNMLASQVTASQYLLFLFIFK